MLWFMLSLTAALSSAFSDTISKHFFSELTPYEMGLIRLLYVFPYLFIGIIIVPWPKLDMTFWACLAIGLPLEFAAFLSYMKAIKVSPLSLSIPFLAFTPAFVILTGYLLLGETLNTWGILGIVLMVVGSYVLNLSKMKGEWLNPWKAIFKEQGSRLMLLTSLIYSFTATLGKLAIRHSSPQFFSVSYFLIFTFFVFCLFPFMTGVKIGNLVKRPFPGIMAGIVLAITIFSHNFAISLIQAAYMLSVKRSSLLFAVIFGAIFFKEEKIKERLLGASIMMAGVCVIAFVGE